MLNKLSLRTKGILLVSLPAVLNLVLLGAIIQVKEDAERQVQDEVFGARLGALTARLELDYTKAVNSASKWHSSRSQSAVRKLEAALEAIEKGERELNELLKDRPEAKSTLNQYQQDAAKAHAFFKTIKDGSSTHFGGDLHPRIFQNKGQKLIGFMLEDAQRLSDFAIDRLNAGRSARESRAWISTIIASSIGANIALAIALALFLWQDIGRRLSIVRNNALALGTGEPLSAPLPESDQIADLDNCLHRTAAALEEATRKENALVDNAIDVLCSIDEQLKFVRVSHASGKTFGYEPEELLGMRFVNLLHDDIADDTIKSIEKIAGKTAEGTLDTRMIRKDGRIVDVRVAAYWSSNEKALFCVIRDVTREREFERIKQKLMDTVAHDLRSPISSIKVVLESLSMGLLGELNEKALTRIQKADFSADRLLRLINDLLDYEKFESGQFALDLQQQSLRDIIDGAVVSIEALAEQKKLEVKTESEDLKVLADSDRITQVVVNLLSNAIKFSPAESSISITARESDEDAVIEIRDHGPGISDNLKDQIFERFKQVEETATKHKGTGLGLPIAKQIVEAHKGQIGVHDAEGGGTVFWFTLSRVVTILMLFTTTLLVSTTTVTAHDTARTVVFPSSEKLSPGLVLIVPTIDGAKQKSGEMIGQARGKVLVPPNRGLSLIVTPEGAANLNQLVKLKPGDLYRIRLHKVPVNQNTFKIVAGLKGLVELDLSSSDTNDSALITLSTLTSLRRLDISKTLVHGQTFSKLRQLRKLKHIDLAYNRLAPNSINTLIKACPQLEVLNLSDTRISDKDLINVPKLKNLKRLTLSKNDTLSNASVVTLSQMKSLTKLDLRNTQYSASTIARLRQALPDCQIKR